MSHVYHLAAACSFKVDTCRAIAACHTFKEDVSARTQMRVTKKVQEAYERAKKDEQDVKDLQEKLSNKRKDAAASQARAFPHSSAAKKAQSASAPKEGGVISSF